MNLRKAFAIAGSNLRRLLRDKTGAFFVFVFPFLIILALGAAFGSGFTPTARGRDAAVGALGQDLRDRLEATEDLDVRSFADADALRTAVERGEIEGGLVIPAGYDERIRAGETVPLTYIARPEAGPGAADYGERGGRRAERRGPGGAVRGRPRARPPGSTRR